MLHVLHALHGYKKSNVCRKTVRKRKAPKVKRECAYRVAVRLPEAEGRAPKGAQAAARNSSEPIGVNFNLSNAQNLQIPLSNSASQSLGLVAFLWVATTLKGRIPN